MGWAGGAPGRPDRVLRGYKGGPLLPGLGLEGAHCQHIYIVINSLP